MKRLSYMACLLLASAAFTACDEDFKDWADPQSNPQEEAITAMVDIASSWGLDWGSAQSPGRSYNCNGRYNSGCQYET